MKKWKLQSSLRKTALLILSASIAFTALAVPVAPRSAPTQPVIRGFADTHNHQFAYLGFGGKAFVGGAYGPINQRLKWCDYGPGHTFFTPNWVHGPGGTRDTIGNILKVNYGGSPLGHRVGGYPEFDGWPRWDSVTHQSVYEDWLNRALQGGLKLMVMLAVNNEAMCNLVEKAPGRTCNDMEAVNLQIAEAKKMEAYIDDKNGGPGKGWYRIVHSPQEARSVINSGKLAVVLGIEVDYLFNCRRQGATCSPEYIASQLRRYYDLGVRHIFPIHFDNNAFGGASYDKALQYDSNRTVVRLPHQFYAINARNCRSEGYEYDGGRCNSLGLTNTGRFLIRAMMGHGMIIDIDHLSALALNDTLNIAESFDYPVVSGHTGFVEISRGDRKNEGNRTAAEVERIIWLGGLVSVILHQGKLGQTRTWRGPGQPVVEHTCGNSSQTLVQAYLYAASKMRGGPVAFGTDFNGYAGLPGPRFGSESCPGGRFLDARIGPSNPVTYPFMAIATGISIDRSVVGRKTFNINNDGLAHVGMLPDLIADFQQMGLSENDLAPLLSSAEGYIRMWEKIERKKEPSRCSDVRSALTQLYRERAAKNAKIKTLEAALNHGPRTRPCRPGRDCDPLSPPTPEEEAQIEAAISRLRDEVAALTQRINQLDQEKLSLPCAY